MPVYLSEKQVRYIVKKEIAEAQSYNYDLPQIRIKYKFDNGVIRYQESAIVYDVYAVLKKMFILRHRGLTAMGFWQELASELRDIVAAQKGSYEGAHLYTVKPRDAKRFVKWWDDYIMNEVGEYRLKEVEDYLYELEWEDAVEENVPVEIDPLPQPAPTAPLPPPFAAPKVYVELGEDPD